MAAPVLAGIAIAAGAAQTVAGVAGASEQNRNIGRSMRRAREGASREQQRLSDRAELERQRNIARARQVAGRIRVTSGAAGTSGGGSFLALQQQSALDAGLNTAIIQRNLGSENDRLRSGLSADFSRLEAAGQSPLLVGLTGALTTGLRIADTVALQDEEA